jgi:hypothetical protein
MLSDDEVRLRFGDEARISRRAGFVLVHLDQPTPARIRRRTAAFDPDKYFDPDCPLCRIQRSQGLVVFDDYGDGAADEEILLE